MSDQPKFIVAEVSKNWGRGAQSGPILAALFEQVIETNRQRGYGLHSFQLHRMMVEADAMNETIIAVFERHEDPGPQSTGERRSP